MDKFHEYDAEGKQQNGVMKEQVQDVGFNTCFFMFKKTKKQRLCIG